jgi:hypothetical protein
MNTRELEWFDLETRMRELILNQLAPITAKAREDREQLLTTRSLCSRLENRLSKVETLVFGDQDQETVIKQIFAKYAETEGNRKKDMIRVDQEMSFIDEKIKNSNFDITKIAENVQNVNKMIKDVEAEIGKIKAVVEHNKESVMKELDNVGRNFRDMNTTYTNIALKAEERAILAFDRSKAMGLEIGIYKRELESIWKSHNEMILLARDSKENKLDIDAFHMKMEDIDKRFKSMQDTLMRYNNEFLDRDVILEKYYPLKIAAMISDFLHYSLDVERLVKLAEYENYLFPELNKETLSHSTSSREILVQKILNHVRIVEERKTKALRLSPKKEVKHKKSIIIENLEQIEVTSSPVSASPPKNVISNYINDELEYSIIEKLAVKIDIEVQRIKSEMETKVDIVAQNIKSSGDQNGLLMKQVLSELADVFNARKKEKDLIRKELEIIKNSIKAQGESFSVHDETIGKLSKMVVCIVEAIQIQQALDAQDEEDRHKLAQNIDKDLQNELIATSSPEQYHSAVPSAMFSVKKNCLACGNATSILSGIRTSVVYRPTPLFYRATMYQRPELIGIKGRLIKSCWEAYPVPFNSEEIEPIFNKAASALRIRSNIETDRIESDRESRMLNLSSFRNKSSRKGSFRIRSMIRSTDRASV